MSKTLNSLTYSLRVDTNEVFDRVTASNVFPHCIILMKDPHDPKKLNIFDCEEVYLFELSFVKLNHYKGAYKGKTIESVLMDSETINLLVGN